MLNHITNLGGGGNPVSLLYYTSQIPCKNKDVNEKHTTKLPEENKRITLLS